MEVQPLATEEYAELKTLGLDGVMVYQETYHESMYAQHHLKGKKQDFFWRLDTPRVALQTGEVIPRAGDNGTLNHIVDEAGALVKKELRHSGS